MNCEPLASTGLDAPVLLVLAVALLFLLAGAGLLLRARRSRTHLAAVLVLVVLAIGSAALVAGTHPSPAFASCPSSTPAPTSSTVEPGPDNSLTITQTSTMTKLAPGVPPADIVGLVVNDGPDSTFITAITVEIVGVTKKSGAATGTCDASDYLLVHPRMPVEKSLVSGGGSSVFRGAAIGFRNKSSNQDACQGARVKLRYTAVPR